MTGRIHYDYGVVILNYNVAREAISAAKSIIRNAANLSFRICLVDNCSTKEGELNILRNAQLDNTDILFLHDNGGYSKGNNAGTQHLLRHYDIDHIVIMNPDVEILSCGTIDSLICRLKQLPCKDYCGIQPLVWTPCLGDAHYQFQVRRVPTYLDMIINHFGPLCHFFLKRFRSFFFLDEIPYNNEFDFYVPCGAFFIIKSKVFNDISFFDERTFLYNEEYMIGSKIRSIGQKFLFCPDYMVQHEGGTSISSHSKLRTWDAEKYEMDSTDIYLRYYLNCGVFRRFLVRFLSYLNYFYHYIKSKYKSL